MYRFRKTVYLLDEKYHGELLNQEICFSESIVSDCRERRDGNPVRLASSSDFQAVDSVGTTLKGECIDG